MKKTVKKEMKQKMRMKNNLLSPAMLTVSAVSSSVKEEHHGPV